MDKKEDPTICCPQETNFSSEDTHRLKMKGWRRIFYANRNQKNVGIPILYITQNRLHAKNDNKR